MSRPLTFRTLALVALLPAVLMGPVATFAHAEAHHRAGHERGDHHAAAPTASWSGAAERHAGDHAHPCLDCGVRLRPDHDVAMASSCVAPALAPQDVRDVAAPSADDGAHAGGRGSGPPPPLRSPPR